MKLRDAPNWPPNLAALSDTCTIPRSDQAVPKSIPRDLSNRVVGYRRARRNKHTYDYEAKRAKLVNHLETPLRKCIGKKFTLIGQDREFT
jgi:hypothetical protein